MIGLISTSAKYGSRGYPNSAVEELLFALQADLQAKQLATDMLSFRQTRLPLPDGQPLDRGADPACDSLLKILAQNRFLILGLTAYMGHISAASKAFFEHFAGAEYDTAYPQVIPTSDMTVAIILIGTDPLTTANGAVEAADLRDRLGWQGGDVVVVNNPRQNPIDYSAVSFAIFSQLSHWLSGPGASHV